MTYLAFDLLLVALPAALLLLLRRPAPGRPRRLPLGPVAVLAPVALLWTAPWDEHLVRTGVWGYAPDAVLARVGSVPAEEYLFVVLEVLLVAAWALRVGDQWPAATTSVTTTSVTTPAVGTLPERRRAAARRHGAQAWVGVTVLGIVLALAGGQLRYLGLLLLWVGPPLALQRTIAGDVLLARRARRALTALPVALWLCAADRLALADGIWAISPASSTGLALLGLPVEEALFFLLTCVLVTDGLLLCGEPEVLARVRRLSARGRQWGASGRLDRPAQAAATTSRTSRT